MNIKNQNEDDMNIESNDYNNDNEEKVGKEMGKLFK